VERSVIVVQTSLSPVLDFFLAVLVIGFLLAGAIVYRERARFRQWLEGVTLYCFPEERVTGYSLGSLFLVSFAGLFIEVMVIRWIGTEVRIFAFFQNLALIACFLGFGLGCYWSQRRKNLLFSLAAMAALVGLVEAPFTGWRELLPLLSSVLSLSPDTVLWGIGHRPQGAAYVALFAASVIAVALLLLLLVAAMIPIGQWVGSYLDSAPNPVSAYSVNLLGSVAGVWVFAGMAFLWLPPEWWFAAAFLAVLVVRPPTRRVALAGAALLAVALACLYSGRHRSTQTYWSPYQKLDVRNVGDDQYEISVNNSGYMTIANLTPAYLARHPELARDYGERSSYDTPYRFAESTERVLIVGAGAGNDAAAALRHGAARVDAVEIDPVIAHLGERLHPEQPYDSPRVRTVLTDARAFLRQTRESYDVIVFGLLDSHTQFSGYSNMRIDNYVYTEDAFREAKRLLKPHGVLVVKFEVRRPWTWIGQRFYRMLDGIFGRPPVVFFCPAYGELMPATVFLASNDRGLWTRAAQPPLAGLIAQNPPDFPLTSSGKLPLTTDDWPYIYHRTRSIPRTYLTVALILLLMTIFMVRGVLEPARVSTWHFFFLGGGFLLLETQMISRLALYFGTTWLVNCIALTAILITLVAANLYVERVRPRRLGPYYVLLLATLLGNFLYPWPHLPYGARTVGVLLSLAYGIPVFFAGVIFTETFRASERKSSAFGANIVGAVAGGLAQILAFIVGMKMLLVFAALSYALAGACQLFQRRAAPLAGVSVQPAAEG
jgi:SAM-dependent methyltransferase